MKNLIIIFTLFFLSCAGHVNPNLLILDRILEPKKYSCHSEKMNVDNLVLVGDMSLLQEISFVEYCIDSHIINPALMNIPDSKTMIYNANEIGLVCDNGLLISKDYVLIDRLFIYSLQRSHEACNAVSIKSEIKKQERSQGI